MKKTVIALIAMVVILAISTAALAVSLSVQTNEKKVATEKLEALQPLEVETESSITTVPTEPRPDVEDGVTGNYIYAYVALDRALEALGVERSAVRDIDVELEFRGGKAFYEVDFEMGQYEYEYHVDALNGEILKSFRTLD